MTSRLARLPAAFVAVLAAWSTQPARSLVTIDVSVTTSIGSTVAGLSKDDFVVFVDGKPVAVETLVAPPAPLAVIALFDVSASMTAYGDIAEEIERSLVPAFKTDDRARIGGIANRLVLSPQLLPAGRALVDAGRTALRFRREERFGPSPIWDAVHAAVEALEPERGRRGIVLVTDGRGTGNTVGSAAAVQSAVDAGVVVQVLSEGRTTVLRQDPETYARVRVGLVLEELTNQTGGMILPESSAPNVQLPPAGPAIARLVNDLHERYTLGISPEGATGSFHRISVRVKRPDLTVRARSGYRVR